MLKLYLAVGVAGALESMLRLLVATISLRLFGADFSIGTFIINIIGSALFGWFSTLIENRVPVSDTIRVAMAVGFIGAYTTFSTFVYESNASLENDTGIKALGSIVAGPSAVRFGIWLART